MALHKADPAKPAVLAPEALDALREMEAVRDVAPAQPVQLAPQTVQSEGSGPDLADGHNAGSAVGPDPQLPPSQGKALSGAFSAADVHQADRAQYEQQVRAVSNSGAEMDLSPFMRKAYAAGVNAGVEESRLKEMMRKLWDAITALMKRIGALMGKILRFPSGHQLTDRQLAGEEPAVATATNASDDEPGAPGDAPTQALAGENNVPMSAAMRNMFHAGQGLTNAVCGQFSEPGRLDRSANDEGLFDSDPLMSYAPGDPQGMVDVVLADGGTGVDDAANEGEQRMPPGASQQVDADGAVQMLSGGIASVATDDGRSIRMKPNLSWLSHENPVVREAYFHLTMNAQVSDLRGKVSQVHQRRMELEQIVTRIAQQNGMAAHVVAEQMRVDAANSSLDPSGDYRRAESSLQQAIGEATLVQQVMKAVLHLPQAHALRQADQSAVLDEWADLLRSSLDDELPPSPSLEKERLLQAAQALGLDGEGDEDAEGADSEGRFGDQRHDLARERAAVVRA